MSVALVIARNTISEAIRRKVLIAFLMMGLAVIGMTFAFGQFQARQDLTIVKGMGLGIISLAGILITVILSINLIPTEVERRTIYTILSKPVRRYEFLLGKYIGALGTLLINIMAMSVLFVIAFAIKQAIAQPDNAINPLSLFKATLMIYMQLLLLASLSVFPFRLYERRS
jgi:ABC-type transport system involved in multi-copper enzyme maturation permease subunit